MGSLIMFLLIGLAAGWIAGKLMKDEAYGLWGDLIIGVVGAFIGSFLFGLLGFASVNLIGRLIAAIVGSVILLYLLRKLKSS